MHTKMQQMCVTAGLQPPQAQTSRGIVQALIMGPSSRCCLCVGSIQPHDLMQPALQWPDWHSRIVSACQGELQAAWDQHTRRSGGRDADSAPHRQLQAVPTPALTATATPARPRTPPTIPVTAGGSSISKAQPPPSLPTAETGADGVEAWLRDVRRLPGSILEEFEGVDGGMLLAFTLADLKENFGLKNAVALGLHRILHP